MRRKRIHIFIWMLLAISIQGVGQVSVKATTDKNSILIGESIQLTLQAYMPLGETASGFQIDSLEHFNILSRSKIDTARNVDLVTFTQTLQITSFDSGRWQIPPFQFSTASNIYQTDSITIDVSYAPFDPKDDYHDIKSIETVEDNRYNKLPWIIGIISVLALIGFYYFFRKKKPVASKEPSRPRLSPYEEAMQALQRLSAQTEFHNGSLKQYYSDLNDVLRVYLDRELAAGSLTKTNEELLSGLRSFNLDKDVRSHLESALRVADFVKFAKYEPSAADNRENVTIIRNAIESLNKQQARAIQLDKRN